MRDGGTLRDFISPTVVKSAQEQKRDKNWLWTACRNRFIIGFTKEVTLYGRPLNTVLTAAILLVAAGMDLSFYRIKNELIFAGMSAGIVLWIFGTFPFQGGSLLAGILLPVLICWIPFRMHALGAGDIKLFSVIGCLNGGEDAVCCICFSFLFAAGISVGKLLSHRQLWTSLMNCFQYFQQIVTEGKMMPYPGGDLPDHRFHFSVAILLGYLALLGVKVCKIMPLCWVALNVFT